MFFQGDQFSFDPSNWIPPSIYFLSIINTLLINFPFHGGLVWSGWYPLDLKAKYVINLHPLPTFHPALCNGPSIHHILSIFLLHPHCFSHLFLLDFLLTLFLLLLFSHLFCSSLIAHYGVPLHLIWPSLHKNYIFLYLLLWLPESPLFGPLIAISRFARRPAILSFWLYPLSNYHFLLGLKSK